MKIAPKATPKSSGNVINLMDALKKSLANEKQAPAPAKAKSNGKGKKKRVEGQREMLLPITGSGTGAAKRAAKEEPKKAAKPARAPARAKKAG